LTHFIRFYI